MLTLRCGEYRTGAALHSKGAKLARTIVLLAVAALIASVVTAAGDAGSKVGANCVQPLDLYSNFQDLSHCNLKV